MTYRPATRQEAMDYFEALAADDDVLALRDIAAKYFDGVATDALVKYDKCDGNLSSCAYDALFFDENGELLDFKPEYGKFEDIGEAIEETESDSLSAKLSGCEGSEQEFDLAVPSGLAKVLFVEEA